MIVPFATFLPPSMILGGLQDAAVAWLKAGKALDDFYWVKREASLPFPGPPRHTPDATMLSVYAMRRGGRHRISVGGESYPADLVVRAACRHNPRELHILTDEGFEHSRPLQINEQDRWVRCFAMKIEQYMRAS